MNVLIRNMILNREQEEHHGSGDLMVPLLLALLTVSGHNGEHTVDAKESSASAEECCELTEKEAAQWVDGMENEDGTTGARWTTEQTEPHRKAGEPYVWWAVMNMMASDYSAVARKYGVDRPAFYADMAEAFLDDKDAGENKAGKYYHCVANS